MIVNVHCWLCCGCYAHILNLLEKDLEHPGMIDYVTQIIKYFIIISFIEQNSMKKKGNVDPNYCIGTLCVIL